jgi:Cu(I)/Ag(I) efflux system membrane protein CusA/SilA
MLEHCKENKIQPDLVMLKKSVHDGAVLRVRPVMMTTVATIAGLLPVFLGTGTGSDLTSRIAAPMVGGMISAVILTLILLPGVYFLWKQQVLKLNKSSL